MNYNYNMNAFWLHVEIGGKVTYWFCPFALQVVASRAEITIKVVSMMPRKPETQLFSGKTTTTTKTLLKHLFLFLYSVPICGKWFLCVSTKTFQFLIIRWLSGTNSCGMANLVNYFLPKASDKSQHWFSWTTLDFPRLHEACYWNREERSTI